MGQQDMTNPITIPCDLKKSLLTESLSSTYGFTHCSQQFSEEELGFRSLGFRARDSA